VTQDERAGREALAVVERYIAGLNARDTEAIRAAFNFPHLRIGANGNLARYEKREDYEFGNFFRAVARDGWHHTILDKAEVVFATVGKAHVAVNFTRCREDDSVIGHYFSLYVVTCQDGHWGIQVGSGNGT
jgi:hypothetical protein